MTSPRAARSKRCRSFAAYLPAGLSDEQVEAEVGAVIAELKPEGPKAFGAVMKEASARLAGRAEGGQIAAAARKLLAS